MQKFGVEITTTLNRLVIVEAENIHDAVNKVTKVIEDVNPYEYNALAELTTTDDITGTTVGPCEDWGGWDDSKLPTNENADEYWNLKDGKFV